MKAEDLGKDKEEYSIETSILVTPAIIPDTWVIKDTLRGSGGMNYSAHASFKAEKHEDTTELLTQTEDIAIARVVELMNNHK